MKRQLVSSTALCCLAAACGAAHAAISVSGDFGLLPANLPIGPGDTDIGLSRLYVSVYGAGQLGVSGGSKFDLGTLYLGASAISNGVAVVDGVNSRVRLRADGNFNRLEVGNWGVGNLTVSGGATLDGRFEASNCLLGSQFCNNFIGNAAGSDATFTITGANSNASFLKAFTVAQLAVTTNFGTPGGNTTGRVNILDGGTLTTDRATLGSGPSGSALGTERSFAYLTISGPGSKWNLTGGTVDSSTSSISTATHANATAIINISNGGQINLQQVANTTHFINLSSGAGRTDMLLTGAGSAVNLNSGIFQVGRGLNGNARLDVTAGAVINDAFYFSTGRGGSFGRTVIDGAGSRVTVNRMAVAGSPDAGSTGAFDIGRDGGIGQVDITNGGRAEVLSGLAASDRARTARLGVGAASQGTLNLSGADSRFVMSVASVVAGGGAAEPLNPYFSVGYQGVGYLNVTAGAKLLMDGGAVSTAADSRSTHLYIGGRSDTDAGGQGFATLSGLGSEIRLSGSDAIVSVGRGPQSSGQLTMNSQSLLQATNLLVGRTGGVGVMSIDNATVRMSGQQTGSSLSGAGLAVGTGTGAVGVMTMSNAALISISNTGETGISLNVGGSGTAASGDGTLQMNSGSRIELLPSVPGNATATIGRDGAGFARLRGGSSLDVGSGALYVGRLSGGDGTLIVSENSVVTAGWVGVGRNRTTTGSVDGGTGTMLINGATLNAVDIVIGTNGYLGGTAGAIHASGTITNYGIFSPGSSPGSFTIDGNFVAGAGSRLILEVRRNASGGYDTDHVYFSEGAALDFGAMNVEFRFLGDTDPTAFQASGGFGINTFLARNLSAGGTAAIDPLLLASASYCAQADAYTISNFTFSATTGASFTATPVPEPGALGLMIGGVALLLARRRRTAARSD